MLGNVIIYNPDTTLGRRMRRNHFKDQQLRESILTVARHQEIQTIRDSDTRRGSIYQMSDIKGTEKKSSLVFFSLLIFSSLD